MGSKRKRPQPAVKTLSNTGSTIACQREGNTLSPPITSHPVLVHYYRNIYTLRDYVINRLESSPVDKAQALSNIKSDRLDVGRLLDSVLVGVNNDASSCCPRPQDLVAFSQQLPASTLGSNAEPGPALLIEVIDFVIWLLFRRRSPPAKPQHLLCQGYERMSATGERGLNLSIAPAIPGIICRYPNPNIESVTSPAWCKFLSLLGRGGDLIVTDLLLGCGLFVPANDGHHSLRQISGTPLSALQSQKPSIGEKRCRSEITLRDVSAPKPNAAAEAIVRNASDIRIVRSRMFYSKYSTNAKGAVRLGLRPIHVLNRLSNPKDESETVHAMKYIFPRQFRLHNVFTCKIDPRETTQAFRDYTLRETEIKSTTTSLPRRANLEDTAPGADVNPGLVKLPKRLRGKLLQLVSAIRKRHQRCSYVALLRYYCPINVEIPSGRDELATTSSVELATPIANVSSFCRAVLRKLLPKDCWGTDVAGSQNERRLMQHVDQFLQARKLEGFTLHQFLDGLQIAQIPWLCPENREHMNMCISDFNKRKELFAEFIYYIFDSLLIPLIRSNFYVTESNGHRNKLFYFRHDVWRTISEPAMASLKGTMLEQVNTEQTRKRLASRTMGYSHIRLLPKAAGFRPVTNLRRRPLHWSNGKRVLGRSINSAMTPLFRVLNYEKSAHPLELGGSLFSVGDIYPKIKAFAAGLEAAGLRGKQMFFAKVDVQACFDTIPQQHLTTLITSLVSAEGYFIRQHAQVKPSEGHAQSIMGPKARVKYDAHAQPDDQLALPPHGLHHTPVEDSVATDNSILVAPLGQQSYSRKKLVALLREHVEHNVIRIGKSYYRQKNGIPQGSVLSSLLCNFFYGNLEKEVLHFTSGRKDTILVRLVDDFLLITTERSLAERFLKIMHQGIPEYGITVRSEKSLANFDYCVRGEGITRAAETGFPYCGLSIDMKTLNIARDAERNSKMNTADSLTVEYASLPGRTFRRKAINGLKIQLHGMFFDTSLNSRNTVLSNLYTAFFNAAQRCFWYIKSLGRSRKLSDRQLSGTIEDMIKLTHTMIKKRRVRRKDAWKTYECAVSKTQTQWLAYRAFHDVFQWKQTKFVDLLHWLKRNLDAHQVGDAAALLHA